jgi:membrane fusion protein (multidrug efflux system)
MNIAVLVLTGIIASGITFFGPWQACGQEKGKEEVSKAKPLLVVAVHKVVAAPLSRSLELTGTATPTRQARLASPSEGPVQDCCNTREGDQVGQGKRLMTIGRSGAAAAQVTAAIESVKEQEAELNRIKILVEGGAVPGSQLDTAKAKYEGARALLAKARELAGDYEVKAPWDGVISKVLVKDGDFVAPRTPLVEMYDPRSLVIRLAVPESQATEVSKGTPAMVHLDAFPDKIFEGKVSLVYPELDTKTRSRTTEVKLAAPVALIPGMFARLKLALQSVPDAVAVPVDAILVQPNGEKVIFVIQESKAQRRLVTTGLEAEGKVQILSGLQAGETVVTAGNEKLKDGVEVKVQGESLK